MKRRNAECGKLRRPIKRNKIAEGMYGSNTFLYVKYLILWAIVITADFMLDFRFEFLWPFWLLLRSVYDSFKYKGLAFSILFVCIAITSDLVCLFFIPVSWLFFLASTYVWVQYVWHADKGFCLPTIFLWMLFLYLEGAVRWRDDSKSIPHVDLCRPFAAHCIGYPVVTLGFGVKSYVGYRIRHRKQREVSKENEFYMQLLHLALPSDDPNQDELMSQMKQTPELLHSDTLGDIDLPVSSAVIAQRIQQQQLATTSTTNSTSTSSSSTSTSSSPSSSSSSSSTTTATLLTNSNSTTCHTTTSNGEIGEIAFKAHHQNHQEDMLDRSAVSLSRTDSLRNSDTKSLLHWTDWNVATVVTGINRIFQRWSTHSTHQLERPGDQRDHRDQGDYQLVGNNRLNHFSAQLNSATKNGGLKEMKNANDAHLATSNGKEKPSQKQNGNIEFEMNNHVYSAPQDGAGTEIMERNRGRRNRAKQKEASHTQNYKDNHSTTVASQVQPSHVPEIKENGSLHPPTGTSLASPLSSLPPICEQCSKFEGELKKCRSEISQLKQTENELRQKCDQNAMVKSCLQVKQKENDDLEKKIQELVISKQMDKQNIQQLERKWSDERRQKQSLEAQLSNERKQRKLAEEKAARPDCSESCKIRKQMLETECKQLRRELTNTEELKKSADQQNRNYEQELRKFEAELRSRESREGTEVLMSAIQAMQDKNCTLEKSLSAETRVKLDLFSALGEAKRQLEILENVIRQKDKEVLEFKGKIAQLYAVMPSVPNDSFLTHNSASGSSILRLNDASLQGPASPMSHAHIGGSPLMNQLQGLSVFTSSATSMSPQTTNSQQQVDQTNGGNSICPPLDPNATVYTPKNDA